MPYRSVFAGLAPLGTSSRLFCATAAQGKGGKTRCEVAETTATGRLGWLSSCFACPGFGRSKRAGQTDTELHLQVGGTVLVFARGRAPASSSLCEEHLGNLL